MPIETLSDRISSIYNQDSSPETASYEYTPDWEWSPFKRMNARVLQDFGNLWETGAAIADALGMDKAQQWLEDRSAKMFENAAEIEIQNTDFSQIKNPLDFGKWTAELVTNFIPDLALMALPGLGGAKILSSATKLKSLAPASVELTKTLSHKLFTKNLKGLIGKQSLKDLSEEAVKKYSLEATKKTLAEIGGIAGVSSFSAVQSAGDAYRLDREKRGDAANPWAALLTGTAVGALETLSPIARGLTGRLEKPTSIGKTILKLSGEEFATETAQEVTQMMHEAGTDQNLNIEDMLTSKEGIFRLVESGLGGAILGPVFGGPLGQFRGEPKIDTSKDAKDPSPEILSKATGATIEPTVQEPVVTPEPEPTHNMENAGRVQPRFQNAQEAADFIKKAQAGQSVTPSTEDVVNRTISEIQQNARRGNLAEMNRKRVSQSNTARVLESIKTPEDVEKAPVKPFVEPETQEKVQEEKKVEPPVEEEDVRTKKYNEEMQAIQASIKWNKKPGKDGWTRGTHKTEGTVYKKGDLVISRDDTNKKKFKIVKKNEDGTFEQYGPYERKAEAVKAEEEGTLTPKEKKKTAKELRAETPMTPEQEEIYKSIDPDEVAGAALNNLELGDNEEARVIAYNAIEDAVKTYDPKEKTKPTTWAITKAIGAIKDSNLFETRETQTENREGSKATGSIDNIPSDQTIANAPQVNLKQQSKKYNEKPSEVKKVELPPEEQQALLDRVNKAKVKEEATITAKPEIDEAGRKVQKAAGEEEVQEKPKKKTNNREERIKKRRSEAKAAREAKEKAEVQRREEEADAKDKLYKKVASLGNQVEGLESVDMLRVGRAKLTKPQVKKLADHLFNKVETEEELKIANDILTRAYVANNYELQASLRTKRVDPNRLYPQYIKRFLQKAVDLRNERLYPKKSETTETPTEKPAPKKEVVSDKPKRTGGWLEEIDEEISILEKLPEGSSIQETAKALGNRSDWSLTRDEALFLFKKQREVLRKQVAEAPATGTKRERGIPHPEYANALEMLEKVSDKKFDKVTSGLSKYLLSNPIIRNKLQKVAVHQVSEGSGSYYSWDVGDNGTIFLDKKAPIIALHEAVHGITSRELAHNPQLKDKVIDLKIQIEKDLIKNSQLTEEQLKEIKNTKSAEEFATLVENSDMQLHSDIGYALRNAREFLSQAFSSPVFQNYLKQTKVDKPQNAGTKTLRTLWDVFVNSVRKSIGLKDNQFTALDKIMSLTAEVAESDLGFEGMFYKPRHVDEAPTTKKEKKKPKTREEQVEVMLKNAVDDTAMGKLKTWSSKAIGVARDLTKGLNERLRKIAPELVSYVRWMEFQIRNYNMSYQKEVIDFVRDLRKLKRDNERDYRLLNLTLMNNAEEDLETRKQLLKDHGMEESYAKVEKVLKDIWNRKEKVGLNKYKEIPGYFTRRVKDLPGLMKALSEDPQWNIIKGKIAELGENPSDADVELAIQSMINTGRMPGIALTDPTSSKKRSILRVSSEWVHFYEEADKALIDHIYESNEKIETRKMFGDTTRKKKQQDLNKIYAELDSDTYKTKDGETKKLTRAQRERRYATAQNLELELKNTEDAEFKEGVNAFLREKSIELSEDDSIDVVRLIRGRLMQKGMHGPWATIRNIALGSVLSSPTSAITQIGDLAFSIYAFDAKNTIGSIKDTILGRALISPKDLDLSHSIKDFQNTGSAKWLDLFLRAGGLTWMDNFGKTTTMNAALKKAAQMDIDSFKKEFSWLLKEKTEQTYNEIKNKENTELVRFFAFNALSEWQPISLSEMPLGYLQTANGKILYALKGYNIKAINNIYRESVHKFRIAKTKSEKRQAGRNLGKLVFFMVLMGVTADELKDFLLGKDAGTLSDKVINNILKIGFMSRYTLDQGFAKGLTETLFKDILMPPTGWIDDPIKDMYKLYKDGKFDYSFLQNFPWGKVFYSGPFDFQGSVVEEKKDMGKLKTQITDAYKEGASFSSIRSKLNNYNAWARKNKEDILTLSKLTKSKQRYLKSERMGAAL